MEPRLIDHQKQHQFTFSRSQSPFEAARTVADFIRNSVLNLGILEVVDLPNGMKALLDHAGGHWMTQPELDPALLPMAVSGKAGYLQTGLQLCDPKIVKSALFMWEL